jgi:hypothetical protein
MLPQDRGYLVTRFLLSFHLKAPVRCRNAMWSWQWMPSEPTPASPGVRGLLLDSLSEIPAEGSRVC